MNTDRAFLGQVNILPQTWSYRQCHWKQCCLRDKIEMWMVWREKNERGWVGVWVGGWASAKVEASYQILQTHHRLAKVASLQEKHRCFRHFISMMKTTVYQNIKCSG